MSIEQRAHHEYSPSSLESLEACPCYKGKESTHERTTAGTKAHAVAESRKDDASLSDDDAEAVAECLDLVEKRKTEMGAGVQEFKEEYWPIDDLMFPDGVSATTAGYADTVLVSASGHLAEIIDYKFGNWKVTNAKENPQGIAYALGVFHRFSTVQAVTIWFIQPLVGHTTSATFTRGQIPELYLRIQVIVARAREARAKGDFSTATPKVPVCSFCANIGQCPRVAEFALKVGQKFYPLEISDNISPTMLHTARDTNIGMRLASVVKVWSEAFRRQLTDRVLARRADMPEGFRLETRTEREIVDMAKLKQVALQHLTPEEFESTLSTTFGGLEEIITEKSPRGSKKEAVKAFKQALEDSGAVKRGAPYSFLKADPKAQT